MTHLPSTNTEQAEAIRRDAVKLTDYIFKAIDMAEPAHWHEWDVFSGRMSYHEQSLRAAQRDSVRKFLEALFKP